MSRKIIGATVGTTLPKPDWNQNDPKKGDYIKNKPTDISGGGGGVFTVTLMEADFDNGTGVVDKSYDEIVAAIESGMVVQCLFEKTEVLPLVRYEESIVFGRQLDFDEYQVWIDPHGEVGLSYMDLTCQGDASNVDLSDYYTKGETDTAIADAIAGLDIPSGGNGGGEVVLINFTTEEPVSMVDIPITAEMKTAITNATCIRWRLTMSGDETATDTTGYGTAELKFWCGWGSGTLLPVTEDAVPSAANKSWAVGNFNGYVFKSPAITALGIESATGLSNNTTEHQLRCALGGANSSKPLNLFDRTKVSMNAADTVLRLATSLPIGTGSRIILAVS